MKKLLLLISIIITISSCKITEKIYLEDDGSGTYNMEIDMSAMIESLSGLGSKDVDSTYVVKDSIMDFSKLILEHKDSIDKLPKAERDKIEKLKNFKLIIHEDKRNNELSTSIVGTFKNVNELNDIQNIFNTTQSSKKQIPSKYDVKFTFKKNKFIRKSTEKELNKEQQEQFNESMKGFNMFLNGTTYNLEYHFPKPIKKTNIKDAKLSEDRKTLYLNKSVNDWINNGSAFDIEVKLKR